MPNTADDKILNVDRANAPGDNNPPAITINADGTYTPTGGVTINPGGVVKFEFSFSSNPDTVCTIPLGTIVVSNQAKVTNNSSGTIKVGS